MTDDPDLPTTPSTPSTPAPGWYVDSTGVTRWWDGANWGEAARVAPTPPVPPSPAGTWPDTTSATPGGYTPPPAQPYGAPVTLDTGAAFSYGWKKFQEYAKEFIIMVVVVALITLVGVLVAFVALLPALSGSTTGAVIGWILYSLAIVAVIAISFVVQAGIFRAGLGVTQGIAPSLSMLTQTTNLGTYIATVLLVSLAYLVGFVLCILPGLAVLLFTAYAPLIALDKGVGPVDAIKQSVEMVRNNLGQVFVLLLLAYAVYYIGSLACYVGLVVSIPVALVMITYSYRVINGEPIVP
jgi:uncharacterized membrane protein